MLFLSEEFPHEVLPASRERYSIAGWFRVNGNGAGRVDPPLSAFHPVSDTGRDFYLSGQGEVRPIG